MPWTPSDAPSLTDRVALVTGATSGLGFETARALAAGGATVALACRDAARGRAAVERIVQVVPAARLEVISLDLASLASVRAAADEVAGRFDRLDLLVNNAGLFSHQRHVTVDGFEVQLGTNHLGHFALTNLLLPQLTTTPGSRVVTISSIGERTGTIRFDDLHFERRYRRFAAYGQSKLANLLFAFHLQTRLEAAGAPTTSVAAHPGGARTAVNRAAPRWYRVPTWAMAWALGQSAARGSLPGLRAALDPAIEGGAYLGPSGLIQQRGHPVPVRASRRARDAELQRRLWDVSEELTGVRCGLER